MEDAVYSKHNIFYFVLFYVQDSMFYVKDESITIATSKLYEHFR